MLFRSTCAADADRAHGLTREEFELTPYAISPVDEEISPAMTPPRCRQRLLEAREPLFARKIAALTLQKTFASAQEASINISIPLSFVAQQASAEGSWRIYADQVGHTSLSACTATLALHETFAGAAPQRSDDGVNCTIEPDGSLIINDGGLLGAPLEVHNYTALLTVPSRS